MTDINLQQRLPKYRAELFADRHEAIQEVTDAVNNLFKAGEERKVLAFRGGRGLGKSWLAFHLVRAVALEQFPKDVLCLLIGLGEAYMGRVIESSNSDRREWLLEEHVVCSSPATIDTAATLRKLLEWFASKIGASTAKDASSDQLAAWIVHRLKQPTFGDRGQYRALVCIVDSAYEADKPFRMDLERALLDNLAQEPHVLLVITGRGSRPNWVSFYLRRYERPIVLGRLREDDAQAAKDQQQNNAETPATKAVDEEQRARHQEEIKQRIKIALSQSLGKDIDPASVDRLLNEADWLPLNTILAGLAEVGDVSWEQAFDELLRFVPKEQRPSIRHAVIALCVLRGFRQLEMEMMQQVEDPATRDKTPALDSPTMLDRLLFYQLASWEPKHGWWTLDTSLRKLARLYLEKEKRDYLRRLYMKAYDMYKLWAQQYGTEHYQKLAAYYESELSSEDNPTEYWSSQAPTLSCEEGDMA